MLKPQSGRFNPERGPKRKREFGPNTETLAKPHPSDRGLYGQPADSQAFVDNDSRFPLKPAGPGGSG